jgi:hypothetical protein
LTSLGILKFIAYCEKNVELARKAISSLPYFNAQIAFQLLDRNDNKLVCD